SLLYLLGPYLVEKIHKTNIFLIFAGAIGCEHVKNFAMLGMGSRGLISITDMDSIENSNLNRQFLFKKPDVGRMKSEIAMRELKKLNPDIKVKNYNIKFDNSNISESFFTDEFLMSQTFIANALDNVDSRLYVDDRCVLLRKAFFDSGTLGTKGNSQPIIPFMTESYSSTRDPPEKSIPLCTIRNFPHAIEHTIEWALSEFTSLFYNDVLSIKSFVDEIFEEVDIPNSHRSKTEYGESKIIDNNEFSSVCNENKQKVGVDNTTNVSFDSKKLKEMIRLITESPHDTDTAIKKSILLFVDLFCDKIHQLIKAFPPDHITEEGLKFWSPPKQAPSPISFDITNNKHVMFVESCANIFKQAFNIKGKIDKEAVIDYYHKELVWENDMINDKEEDFHKTEFEKVSLKNIYFEKVLKEKVKARTGVRSSSKMIKRKNAADNSYDKNNFGDDNIVFCLSSDDEDDSSNCIIPGYSKEKFFKKMTPGDKDYLDSILNNLKNITPIEFEKDNDLNYHVSFVYAAANLRADNYGIQNADRLKIKGIAGRIIPAIATTTAVISGLNVIEMIKYIFKLKTYKNSFINLALPFIGFSEPPAPEKYKCRFVEKVKEDKEEPKDEKSDFEEDETKDEKDENRDTLEFTIWDQFEFKDCTLAEMISFFKNHEKIVSMVTFGSKILYSSFYNKEEYDQNLSKRISELVPEKRIIKLDILFDGDDDGDQLPVTVVHIC
ncbi:Ubiquitin-like modifier-activating enzyme 1, partial [Dictyocoela roeselum]